MILARFQAKSSQIPRIHQKIVIIGFAIQLQNPPTTSAILLSNKMVLKAIDKKPIPLYSILYPFHF